MSNQFWLKSVMTNSIIIGLSSSHVSADTELARPLLPLVLLSLHSLKSYVGNSVNTWRGVHYMNSYRCCHLVFCCRNGKIHDHQ